MAPRTRIIGAVRFLLFSASVLAVLAQPGVAVAQTCGDSVAFDRLVAFRSTITAADVVDLADVQKGLDGAIASLADNVSGARSRLDRLCDRLADLVSGNREVFIAADDCVGAADSITCDGAEIFENYQDAIEDLAEDALPKITSSKRGELRDIIAQVYASIELLVALVIEEAKHSVSSASDSPAFVDAVEQQKTALGQEVTCFDPTQVGTRACGDAVGSFFDAWLNGIIEIID